MLDVGLHVDGVPNQTTPLHSAAEEKQTEMVRFLLQRGADPDGRPRRSDDDQGRSFAEMEKS
jgi:ankyrin repeat protein